MCDKTVIVILGRIPLSQFLVGLGKACSGLRMFLTLFDSTVIIIDGKGKVAGFLIDPAPLIVGLGRSGS